MRSDNANIIHIHTVESLLKDTSEMSRRHCSVPFDIPCIDMHTYKTSEIRTPPYTLGQLYAVPMVSLVERFTVQGR